MVCCYVKKFMTINHIRHVKINLSKMIWQFFLQIFKNVLLDYIFGLNKPWLFNDDGCLTYHILAFAIWWLIKKWLVNPYRV
jgi:hypothetical protein